MDLGVPSQRMKIVVLSRHSHTCHLDRHISHQQIVAPDMLAAVEAAP